MVVNELCGEKIDIVPSPRTGTTSSSKALQPAKVKEVRIDEESRTAEVIVPTSSSLAIGKEGQNARLATRLSGLRDIDIRSETDIAEQEAYERTYGTDAYAEGAWIVDPETGEQMWQPSDGSPAWTTRAVGSRAGRLRRRDPSRRRWQTSIDGDIAEAVEEVTGVIAAAEVDEEEAELGRGRRRRGRGRAGGRSRRRPLRGRHHEDPA